MATAAEIVRGNRPDRLSQDRVDQIVDTLQAPYPERILRTIRTAMRQSDEPARQAELIVQVIDDLGLQPYVAPDPLPDITDEDVNLVCWQAIVPSDLDPAWFADGQLPIGVPSAAGQTSFADPR